MSNLLKLKISMKLPIVLVALSLLSAIAMGITSYTISNSALDEAAKSKLEASRETSRPKQKSMWRSARVPE